MEVILQRQSKICSKIRDNIEEPVIRSRIHHYRKSGLGAHAFNCSI
ncbi:unnamed protein product [Pylaiella littoralis]